MKNNFQEISYETFQNIVTSSANPSLLCGNGLSINFEPQLTLNSLGENLYKTHTHIVKFSDYKVVSPKMKPVLLPNYKATIKYLERVIHNAEEFLDFFSDAVNFAKGITNPQVIEWITDNKFNTKLVMGFGPLDYVTDLIKQAESSDSAFKVNYEYWTILIYFALVLAQAPSNIYISPEANKFVKAVSIGAEQSLGIGSNNQPDYFSKTCENGMFTYLRLLLATNILLVGNGYHVEQMSKWDFFQRDVLKQFFALFNYVITTNYDLLAEKIIDGAVSHLHGCYTRQPQIVLGQSLGVFIDAVRYDLSSILIGDYFVAKSFYATTVHIAQKSSSNTKINFHQEVLKQIIEKEKSDTIVIFGLNINNDYHIVRDLQVFLYQSGMPQANIIFCYFSKEDRTAFREAYESCITYSEELNKYVQEHISTYTIDSHSILQRFFIEKDKGIY